MTSVHINNSETKYSSTANHRLLGLLSVIFLALTPVAQAQIPVNISGSGVITFATQPAASSWATINMGGATADFTTLAQLNTAVETNQASLINTTLPNINSNAPAAQNTGCWDSVGQYVFTRVTGRAYAAIMATLTNISAVNYPRVMIQYDFGAAFPVTEEVPGFRVYYSLTGTPNSWSNIAEISGYSPTTNGTYSATLDLSANPWAPGSKMYLLWADENATATPDTLLMITNFSATPLFSGITVTITPGDQILPQGGSVTYSLGAVSGGTGPYTYQWCKDSTNSPISGQTGTSLTLNSLTSAANGAYMLVATDSLGAKGVSQPSSLTVTNSKIINLSGNFYFQNVPVGQTATATLVVSNSGNSTLNVSSISYPNEFSGAFSGAIPANSSTSVTVTFAPVASGYTNGTITVNSDATSGGNTVAARGIGFAVTGNWAAFNDHIPGTIPTQTRTNVTTYNLWATNSPASGNLTNILTGAQLPAMLIISNTATTSGSQSGVPLEDTPLANTFDGLVYFGSANNSAIQMPTNSSVTYTFTNLDVSKYYTLSLGAVRAGSGYTNRWTTVELLNVVSATPDHKTGPNSIWGILTPTTPNLPQGCLSNYQAALLWGLGTNGDMAQWSHIVPAGTGTQGYFTVVCWQYTNTVPTNALGVPGSAAGGAHGYAPSGIKLEEFQNANAGHTLAIQPGATPGNVIISWSPSTDVLYESSSVTGSWSQSASQANGTQRAATGTKFYRTRW